MNKDIELKAISYENIINHIVLRQYELYKESENLFKFRYTNNETISYFLVRCKEIKLELEVLERLLKNFDYNNISTTYFKLKGVDDLFRYVK